MTNRESNAACGFVFFCFVRSFVRWVVCFCLFVCLFVWSVISFMYISVKKYKKGKHNRLNFAESTAHRKTNARDSSETDFFPFLALRVLNKVAKCPFCV